MITLDAGVLIALFNAKDAHHEAAMKLLDAATRRDDLLYMNPLSQAEVLVKAAQQGSEKIYYCLAPLIRFISCRMGYGTNWASEGRAGVDGGGAGTACPVVSPEEVVAGARASVADRAGLR